jgi:hypothetical protein
VTRYPFGWGKTEEDWLMPEFRRLRDFYAAAKAHGRAVITLIE